MFAIPNFPLWCQNFIFGLGISTLLDRIAHVCITTAHARRSGWSAKFKQTVNFEVGVLAWRKVDGLFFSNFALRTNLRACAVVMQTCAILSKRVLIALSKQTCGKHCTQHQNDNEYINKELSMCNWLVALSTTRSTLSGRYFRIFRCLHSLTILHHAWHKMQVLCW